MNWVVKAVIQVLLLISITRLRRKLKLDSDLKFAKERFERIESFEEAICGNTKTRKI